MAKVTKLKKSDIVDATRIASLAACYKLLKIYFDSDNIDIMYRSDEVIKALYETLDQIPDEDNFKVVK